MATSAVAFHNLGGFDTFSIELSTASKILHNFAPQFAQSQWAVQGGLGMFGCRSLEGTMS